MTKQEKANLSILYRQLQQSLEYLHCGRVDDGRIVAEIVERELGKLVNKQKTKQALVAFFIGWNMKNYNIDAKTTGAVTKVDITNGNLKACLCQAGNVRKIIVTGRGNVRQIKTIAKAFHDVLKEGQ